VENSKAFLAKWMDFRGDRTYSCSNEVTWPDFIAYEWLLRTDAIDASITVSHPKAAVLCAALGALDGAEAFRKDAETRPFNNPRA
jgi:hypothetical protein